MEKVCGRFSVFALASILAAGVLGVADAKAIPAVGTATSAPATASTSALAAAPGDIGYQGPSSSGTGSPSASKPESKLWWTDGFWWAVMWDPASADFHIFKLNLTTQTWVDTGVPVDDRSSTRADALWDGNKLYIASHFFAETSGGASPARLYRYSYTAATDTYTLDAGFPVQINNLKTETLVIDKDSTGKLWATWVMGKQVWVNRTTGNDLNWGTPFQLPVSSSLSTTDDISSLVAFDGNKIGLMWSNQTDDRMYFSIHLDGDPDTTWQPRTVAYGTQPDDADDHINLKTDASGRLYVVTKTAQNGGAEPLIVLHIRNPDTGVWSHTTYGTPADSHTRPILVADDEHNDLHVFATGPQPPAPGGQAGGDIELKVTSSLAPSFAPGEGQAVIREAAVDRSMNNATSTKQPVNSTTGLVVLALNDTTFRYWHHYDPLGGTPPTPAPTAFNGAVGTAPGTSVSLPLSATDSETCNLGFTIVNGPVNGTLGSVVNAPCTPGVPNRDTASVTYTPAAGFTGTDTVTFRANDGGADSNLATISITVTASNAAPVASNQAGSTQQGAAIAITLNATDVETCELSFAIVGSPSNGTLGPLTNPFCTLGTPHSDSASVTYTPAPGFSGTDSFTYRANDGTTNSSTATVTVTVNGPPAAADKSATTPPGTAVGLTLSGTDAETCELQFTIVSLPANGLLGALGADACASGSPNSDTATVTYMPAPGFNGADSFTYRVSDGSANSNLATVSITVVDPNQTIFVRGTSSTLNNSGSSLIVSTPSGLIFGDVMVATVDVKGSATITPPPGWTQIRADSSGSNLRKSTFYRVAGLGEPTSYTFMLSTSRAVAGGIIAFSGVDNANPIDAQGGQVNASSTSITAPSVTTTVENTMLVGFYEILGATSVTPPSGMSERWDVATTGSAKVTSEAANTPHGPPGATGARVATAANAQVSIGHLIALRPGPATDPPPLATDKNASTNQGTAVSVTLSATDTGTCELGFTIVNGPANGTLGPIGNAACTAGNPNIDTAAVTYTPNPGFGGSDTFTYRANDGNADSNTATVTVSVAAPPVASNKALTTTRGTPVTVTLSATDIGSCELGFTIVSPPSNGSLGTIGQAVCTSGNPNTDTATVVYTPNAAFTGTDTFTYKANDGTADSNTATVTMTVNAAPIAADKSTSTLPSTPITITLTATDAESCELAFAIVTAPANGAVGSLGNTACSPGSPNSDSATVTYTPNAGFGGSDSFTYKVNDGAVDSNIATVSISVDDPNQTILFRASSSGANPTSETLDLPTPAGVVAGDVMIASMDIRGTPAVTAPAGWTEVRTDSGSGMKKASYVRVAGPGEPASYTWTLGAPKAAAGGIVAFSGVHTTNPIAASSGQANASSTTFTAPSLTAPVDNTMLVALYGAAVLATVAPPAGMTERWESTSSLGTFKQTSEASNVALPNAGPSGDRLATASKAGGNIGQLIALRAGAAGNTPPAAVNKSALTTVGVPVTVTLSGTDAESCELAFTIVGTPANGTLGPVGDAACVPGNPNSDTATLTYTPNAGFSGTDTVTYRTNDGISDSNLATVTFTVNAVPIAADKTRTTEQNTPLTVSLSATDTTTCELSFSIVSGPSNGTLSVISPEPCAGGSPNADTASVTYTPSTNYLGSDSFTYRVNDGVADSNVATVSLTVTPPNGAPIAANKLRTTEMGAAVTVTLSATDAETCELGFTIVAPPANGGLGPLGNLVCTPGTPNADTATVTYTPNAGFSGNDTFTYRANDGATNGNVATVTVTVNGPPTPAPKALSTEQDSPASVTLTATDVESCELTFSIVSAPTSGSVGAISPVACTPGSPNADSAMVTYTPNAGFTGTDSFTYRANDGTANSGAVTVTVTVNPPNTPPTAANKTASTLPGAPVTVTLSGIDTTTCELDFTIVSGPTNGTLGPLGAATCTAGSPNSDTATVTYTPNGGFVGSDSFTYRVNDGTADSTVATVSLSVTTPPTAVSTSGTGDAGTAIVLTLTATDSESCELGFSIVSGPANGTLGSVGNAGCTPGSPNTDTATVTYTPNGGFADCDSFTFRASDGSIDSAPATVNVSVVDPNQTINCRAAASAVNPTANSIELPKPVGVVAGDVMIATMSVRSTPSITAPSGWTHIRTDQNSMKQATYYRAAGGSEPASYTWTWAGTPRAAAGGIVAFSGVSNSNPIDAHAGQTTSVSFSITAPSVTTTVDNTMLVGLFGTAIAAVVTPPAGMAERWDIASAPGAGTVKQTSEAASARQATAGASGNKVATADRDANNVGHLIALRPASSAPNAAPVAANKSRTTEQGAPVSVTLTATDAETCELTFTIVSGPTNGSVGPMTNATCATGTPNADSATVTYTPNAGYSGPDSFTYKANDGTTDSNVATVTLTVNPANAPPTAADKSAATGEAAPVSVTLTATDAETCELAFSIVSQPANGTLSAISPLACTAGSPNSDSATLTYTPNAGFTGGDSFTYRANDGSADSNTATVTVNVTATNDPPVAADVTETTLEGSPVGVTLSATDAETCELTFTIVSGPTNGTLSPLANVACAAGTPNTDTATLTYTPNAGTNGTDTFTYRANDGSTDSNLATVTINVTPVDASPVAADKAVSTPQGDPVAVTLSATDEESCELAFSIAAGPATGTLGSLGPVSCTPGTPNSDTATVTYTPAAGFSGTATFTYRANDGNTNSNTATVTITVTAPPVAQAVTRTTPQNTPVTITLTATDTGTCDLTFTIDSQPANGTLGAVSNAACTPGSPNMDTATVVYTPNNGFSGSDSFTYHANDGSADSNVATVSLTVNSPPVAADVNGSTPIGTPVVLTLSATDAETCQLTFSIVSGPANGTLSSLSNAACVAGSPNSDSATVTYTPNAGFSGSDTFTYRATDGSTDSNLASATVSVTAAPTAADKTATTAAGVPVSITLSATDTGTCELGFSIVAGPTNGTLGSIANLACTAGSPNTDTATIDYTPNAGFAGADSFTYRANDGSADSNTATVTITVNVAPTAAATRVATTVGSPVTVPLQATDPETCQLGFTIVSQPVNGTLGTVSQLPCTAGSPNTDTATVNYTPSAGFRGCDSFSYVANDGSTNSAPVTAVVSVTSASQTINCRSISTGANAATTTLEIAAPLGVQTGDVMIASLDVRGSVTINAPAGWTLVRSDPNGSSMRKATYYRVAGSSEPGSFTWTFESPHAASGGILAFSGVDNANPIDASGGQANASSTSITAPSITTSVANTLLVGLFGTARSTAVAPPGDMAEQWEVASTLGAFKVTSEAASVLQAAVGATGAKVATAGGSSANVGHLLALRPAP